MSIERRTTDRTGAAVDPEHPGQSYRQQDTDPDLSAGELLDLLGDDTTRRVLRLIAEEPMGGRDVAEATSVSRATAYRHLKKLEESGLVATRMVCDPDGHHRQQFYTVLEGANLSVDPSGLAVSVSTGRAEAGSCVTAARAGGADDH